MTCQDVSCKMWIRLIIDVAKTNVLRPCLKNFISVICIYVQYYITPLNYINIALNSANSTGWVVSLNTPFTWRGRRATATRAQGLDMCGGSLVGPLPSAKWTKNAKCSNICWQLTSHIFLIKNKLGTIDTTTNKLFGFVIGSVINVLSTHP